MSKRSKALRDFQNDPPTTVFLLSMRAGAVGINLTQANHVFLMEPCFNPALEAQAVGRVHRLGQQRAVTITHLVMEDSVETRIRQMLENKYGSTSATAVLDQVKADGNDDDGDDDEQEEEDKKPAAKPTTRSVAVAASSMVGSIATDRAAVMEEEFDLLFGVTPPVPDMADNESTEDDTMSAA